MPEVATPNQAEREFETGEDEFFKHRSETNANQSDPWFGNIKRTYDEFQHESLESIRRNRSIVDKIVSDAQQYDNQRQAIANQALQNAIETANITSKQAIRQIEEMSMQYRRHSDLAADSFWNPVASGAGMNLTAGAVPGNRITDTVGAVAGGTVDVAAAGVATANLGVLQQLIAQLTQATQAIAANVPVLVTAAGGASTPSQTQAKPTA